MVVTKAGGIDGLMEDAVCCSMTDVMEIQPNADDDDAMLDNAEMIQPMIWRCCTVQYDVSPDVMNIIWIRI